MSSQPFQQWPSVTYPPPGGRHLDNCQVSSLLWVCGYIYFITPGNTQYLYCLNSNLLKLCIKYFNNLGFFLIQHWFLMIINLYLAKWGKRKLEVFQFIIDECMKARLVGKKFHFLLSPNMFFEMHQYIFVLLHPWKKCNNSASASNAGSWQFMFDIFNPLKQWEAHIYLFEAGTWFVVWLTHC